MDIKKYITRLYESRKRTPQEQLDVVRDMARRGLLKQIIDITTFSAFATTCCALPNEYTSFLPDIGDSDRANLSPTDADFLGKQVILDIQRQGDMLNDYDTLAYLNNIGANLVSYSPLAGQDFNFYVIKDKEINAFALPGGYICIYNGLIYTTRSESELTSVMSHEIAHVVQHHIFRNISVYNRNQWLGIAGLLAAGLLAAVNPAAAILAANGGQGMAMQNILAYSRNFEREADRVGQKIMYSAGFDPHAMPDFFQRLKDQERFNDNEAYEFLRTHPVTSERISEAEERANQLTVKMRPDSNDFLLIREKCRVRQLGKEKAIPFYTSAIATKKYVNLNAQYYGLAFANYVKQLFNPSLASLNKISDPDFTNNPIIINLKARTYVALKKFTQANNLFEQGLDTYPNYKGLWLGQVDLLMASKQLKAAGEKLDDLSDIYPHDLDIWTREALIYADSALNKPQKYYYALGNQMALLGNYEGAISQYQMALKAKGDNTLNDIISARILDTQTKIKTKAQYSS